MPANVTNGEELADHLKAHFYFLQSTAHSPTICSSYQIIITHPDKDHINLINILYKTDMQFKQNTDTVVYLGGDLSHYTSGTAKALLANIVSSPIPDNNIIILSHRVNSMTNKDFLTCFINTGIPTTALRRPFIMHLPIDSFLSPAQGGSLEFLGINAYQSNADDTYNSYVCADGDTYTGCLTDAHAYPDVTVPDSGAAVNGSSAVVRLKLGDVNFIFTGDATDKTTKRILEKTPDINRLKTRILLASHHGADGPTLVNASKLPAEIKKTYLSAIYRSLL